MNEALESLKEKLVDSWMAYDLQARKDYRECNTHEDFNRWFGTYGKTTYNRAIGWALEDVKEKNTKEAVKFCENLEEKVKSITGKIKSWETSVTGNSLYAYIINGENGNAKVIQIYAGGYNIVRLHVRNIIQKVK